MRADRLLLFILCCLVAATALAQSEPYVVGDRISEFSLQDQHEKEFGVDASTRVVLFSRDMDGGRLLEAALADTDQALLTDGRTVYVSDISGMPSLIARMFAIPSMRKRPYSMLLDRTGDETQRLPDVEGRATVIFLDSLLVERIEHAESANAVRSLLGLDPLPEDDS